MRKVYSLIILFSMFSSYSYADKNLSITVETAVQFNTVCAKCHEGECSGRLTFNSSVKTTFSHISRYLPHSSKAQMRELFTILEYMKKECNIYFPNLYLHNKKNWLKKELTKYSLPSKKAYFIPLGLLKKGEYKLKIDTKKSQLYKIMIISENFEIVLDEYITSCKNIEDLSYLVENSSKYYLRVESRNKLIITSLRHSYINRD